MVLLQDIAAEAVNTDFTLFSKLGSKFFLRLGIDILTMIILIRVIYLPIHKKPEYVFTFFTFNFIIFLITFLLNKVELSMGAAFGLFAVFSMLRYRTEDISLKDMTYLFLVIATGLTSAVTKGGWDELTLICSLILILTYLLEANIFIKKQAYKIISYENIDLIKPENYTLMLEDLKKRTGLDIHRASVGKIDFLRDAASVTIYYYEPKV